MVMILTIMFTAKQKVLMQLVSGPKTYGDLKSVTRNPKHLSNILSQLEKEGLITWELAPNDRRVKIYHLTEKAKRSDVLKQKALAYKAFIPLAKFLVTSKPDDFNDFKDFIDKFYYLVGAGLVYLLLLENTLGKFLTEAIITYMELVDHRVRALIMPEAKDKLKEISEKQFSELPESVDIIDSMLKEVYGDNKKMIEKDKELLFGLRK